MIRTKGTFARIGEVWFDEIPEVTGVDVLYHRQSSKPRFGSASSRFPSLVNNLMCTENALWNRITKNTRYEIRRAESTDVLELVPPEVPNVHIASTYLRFHNAFAASKARTAISDDWLKAASASGQLEISLVRRQGELLVAHAYVTSGPFVRLYQSASLFRVFESKKAALIARANRLLHWHDILAFKKRGFETYDWGGIFNDPRAKEELNINRFKEQFGGANRTYYNWTESVTLRGRLYLSVRNHLSRARLKSQT